MGAHPGGHGVPPFDIGLTPQVGRDEPKLDDKGQGLTQRVPLDAAGSYAGCPVHGFGYSELIVSCPASSLARRSYSPSPLALKERHTPPVSMCQGRASSSPAVTEALTLR